MAIRRSNLAEIKPGEVVLVGIPFDTNSSFLQGPAKAPPLIIEALESDSANYFTEDFKNLSEHAGVC